MKYCLTFYVGKVHFFVHPLSVLSLLALCFAECGIYSAAVILCALLHELGHIAALLILGEKVREFCFLPCGLELRTKPLGYREELIIVLSGPFTNLLLIPFFYALSDCYGAFFLFCADCCLFSALFNLLPLRGFDGNRAVKCLLFMLLPYEKADLLQNAIEKLSLLFLFLLCASACVFCEFNLSLAVIFIYLTVTAYGASKTSI